MRRSLAGLLAAAVGLPAAAGAAEPRLEVPRAQLAAALHCPASLAAAKREPILLIHGTGGSGQEEWVAPVDLQGVLQRTGHPTCYVELPAYALADVQTAAEYVVAAARTMHRRSGRRIALYGHSQGGLLIRWALTWWPSLRRAVADAVPVAGTLHGTTWGNQQATVDALCTPAFGCPPAMWQQTIGSQLLDAFGGRDETPRGIAWTTIRSATDDLVQPQTGPRPTSALRGAVNVEIQAVCPGRQVNHVEAAYDSVSYAALLDAASHAGPALPARFPKDVCAAPYAPGLDAATVRATSQAARAVVASRVVGYRPQQQAEPPVRAYARG